MGVLRQRANRFSRGEFRFEFDGLIASIKASYGVCNFDSTWSAISASVFECHFEVSSVVNHSFWF